MNMKWLKPNEGRLHKGNPFTRVTKEISRTSSRASSELSRTSRDIERAGSVAGSQIESEVGRAGENALDSDWWSQAGEAALVGLGDPRTWAATIIAPGSGLDILSTASSTGEAWEAMSQAQRDEAQAAIEAETASREEERLMDEQRATEAEQAQMVADREAEATAITEERIKRLGTGRRGLLYQGSKGSETGTKTVLGG